MSSNDKLDIDLNIDFPESIFSQENNPNQLNFDFQESIYSDHRTAKIEEYSEEKYSSRKLDEEIENLKANRELRDKYSFKVFKVVKKSLWGWAILLFIYGLVKLLTRHENGGFEIFSDHVLIAITTATTLNIFAGFLSLIRGLFPSIKEDIEKN